MVTLLAGLAGQARAQSGRPYPSLPDYAPLNPALSLRSGLFSYGYRDAQPGWSLATSFEYGSAAELHADAASSYILDAELMRAELLARRDLTRNIFMHVQAGVTGSYAGFGDAFFDAFHRMIRYEQAAREARPRNEFAYEIRLSDGRGVRHERGPLGLADVRVGIGRRHTPHVQSFAAITLPTTTAFRRGVPSFALVHAVRLAPLPRLHYEGSIGAGYTPAHGDLTDAQRTTFWTVSSGARADVWRGQSVYVTVFYHSAPYHGTHVPQLDHGELSTEFGLLLRAQGGREWRLGLVEDLRYDAGIDLIVRLGTSK